MAVGLAVNTANKLLDAIFNNVAYSVAQVYIQLHTGDPGAAGTANVAGNATRKAVSCSVAASGAITIDAALSWTGVPNAEDFTHYSLWDALTNGVFIGSGLMTANAVAINDNFTIPVGELDHSFNLAA